MTEEQIKKFTKQHYEYLMGKYYTKRTPELQKLIDTLGEQSTYAAVLFFEAQAGKLPEIEKIEEFIGFYKKISEAEIRQQKIDGEKTITVSNRDCDIIRSLVLTELRALYSVYSVLEFDKCWTIYKEVRYLHSLDPNKGKQLSSLFSRLRYIMYDRNDRTYFKLQIEKIEKKKKSTKSTTFNETLNTAIGRLERFLIDQLGLSYDDSKPVTEDKVKTRMFQNPFTMTLLFINGWEAIDISLNDIKTKGTGVHQIEEYVKGILKEKIKGLGLEISDKDIWKIGSSSYTMQLHKGRVHLRENRHIYHSEREDDPSYKISYLDMNSNIDHRQEELDRKYGHIQDRDL